MIIALRDGKLLATSKKEADEYLTAFLESTTDECVEALISVPSYQIKEDPESFKSLAIQIAMQDNYTGAVKL